MKRCFVFLVMSAVFLGCGGLAAATTPGELNDAVLFFVNDPQEMTFMDMNKLVERNKLYHSEREMVSEDQIAKFFETVQSHGVPAAGSGQNKIGVAYVVQNSDQDTSGVMILKGDFDREKVIQTIEKHYVEHSGEHGDAVMKGNQFAAAHGEQSQNPFQSAQTSIDGAQCHIYPMPLRNREFIVASTKEAVFMSSAKRGQRDLLKKSIAVVQGKIPSKPPSATTKVVMTFAPTKMERKQMEDRIWARYDQQKQTSLSKKRFLKRIGERFRQKVIKNKVQFFVDALNDMDHATMIIERSRQDELAKTATIVAEFESSSQAAEVKKRLMKHLVKEIKRTDNVQDKFAMGNISITTVNNRTILRCQLRDSKEQLHAFHLISSYVAKGILERL